MDGPWSRCRRVSATGLGLARRRRKTTANGDDGGCTGLGEDGSGRREEMKRGCLGLVRLGYSASTFLILPSNHGKQYYQHNSCSMPLGLTDAEAAALVWFGPELSNGPDQRGGPGPAG
ncbi:hypothetical protein E2542_SST02950 [Spatholobus suberectus]|nr:hypothetical protein E2542_SST02950 [Spatholobus suberectus]